MDFIICGFIMIYFFLMEDNTCLYLEIVNVFDFRLENYFNIKWHLFHDCYENFCNIFMGINHVHISVLRFNI